MGGVGGGVSGGQQKSKSSGQFNERVFGPQQEALGTMYDSAADLYGQRDYGSYNQVGDQATGYNQNIADQSMPGWGNQMQGGFEDPYLSASLRDSMANPSEMGKMYESIVGGSGNEYIDPMVDAMRESSMKNYQAQTRPNMDQAAAMAGQSGSSRHGVNQYLAEKNVGSDMLNRENQMRGDAYDKDLNWKMGIAQQADMGRGQAQDRAMQMLSGRNDNQAGALNFGQGMQQMGMGGMAPQQMMQDLPWDQFANYANSIGAPTVLGSGSESSKASGWNAGASGQAGGKK
jgi:hypothetical protein